MNRILQRLAQSVLTVFGALTIVFLVLRLTPGDPTAIMLGDYATPELVATLRRQYGLDQPLPVQFGHYLLATARGDLGFSIHFNQPVSALVLHRIGWTLLLAGGSLTIAASLGSLLGLLLAWRARSRWSVALGLVALLGGSLPEFVVGLALLVGFAVAWPLFPARGALSPFRQCGVGDVIGCATDAARHVVLPGLTLILAHLPAFLLIARGAASAEAGRPYVAVARAKGLTEPRIALRHVARNAAVPVLAYVGVRVGLLLGGVVIVETLFAYPGLGQLTFIAIESRDYPLLESLFLIFGVAIILMGLVSDLLLARLDPRPQQAA